MKDFRIDTPADRLNETIPTTVMSTNSNDERLRAALKVAAGAISADDGRQLLDMLRLNEPDVRASLDEARAKRKAGQR